MTNEAKAMARLLALYRDAAEVRITTDPDITADERMAALLAAEEEMAQRLAPLVGATVPAFLAALRAECADLGMETTQAEGDAAAAEARVVLGPALHRAGLLCA